MRKKLMLGAVLGVLVAVAGVPFAFAGGDWRHDDDDDRGDIRIIHLTTHVVQETDLDLGAAGPSQGDRFVFANDVFMDGRSVGTDGGECVIVRFSPGPSPEAEPAEVIAQCTATLALPGGQITGQGLVDFTQTGPFTIAITGGTGKYRTAHGEVEVTEESAEVDRLKLTLIL